MKENFKIEKELLFKHNIKDITSISLDREYKVEGNDIKGNFLINGEYKVHELSLNKEKFNFKIPFKYELKDDIDRDSLNVEILNFVYDYGKDELMVNIEYEVSGDRKDILIFDDEESLDDFLKTREVDVVDTRVDEIKEIVEEKEDEKEGIKEDEKVELIPSNNNCDIKEVDVDIENKEDRNIKDMFEKVLPINSTKNEELIIEDKNVNIETKEESVVAEEIVNNFSNYDNNFITYKVYKLSEIDTIESIVMKFHTSIDELKEYNDLANLSTNSKIIIPIYER